MEYVKGDVDAYHPAGVMYLSEDNYRLFLLTQELNDGFYFSSYLTIKDALLSNGAPWFRNGLRMMDRNIVATFGWRDRLTDEMQYIAMTAKDDFS